ncbi:MAG: fatty acid cis/trans isomerase, partial [Gammaproteobacteria bacterium]
MIKRTIRITSVLSCFILLTACGQKQESITQAQADVDYDILQKEESISFVKQARPVLEQRCIVCHGCYDAPCQLKLSSIEGIKRGSNPEKVYNAERLLAIEPTRLFIDANSEEEWRAKGFHSVLNEKENDPANNLRHSVLYNMLRLKQLKPQPRVGMIDDSFDLSLYRDQTCPGNDKFDQYAEKFPMQGMPFGMPNLSDKEYHILVKWISQGLPDDSNVNLPLSTEQQIKKWETFFNKSDIKHKLVSRYLYEHLFLGHLYFKGADNREFFRLVRSYTPPGKPIKEIATVRAFDDPGVAQFYYRLRYYKSSIVDKTHFIYELSDKRMARYKELFINNDYQVNGLPSYKPEVAANPIKAFIDIPTKSRYLFLLDDAKYFIEGFIKSPSCRGQVALNVIEDNFWVFFSNPDLSVVNHNDHYMDAMVENLNLPAEKGNTLNLLSAWSQYWDPQHDYMLKRQKRFGTIQKMDLDQALKYVWNGESSMDKNNRTLTIFRHFDSATVKHGLIGDYPETAWIIDYPLLERIHYLLVAGYNVYGNVGHQLTSRLYMDFLRMEGE